MCGRGDVIGEIFWGKGGGGESSLGSFEVTNFTISQDW